MANILLATLRILKLPLKSLVGWRRKRQKNKNELADKQRKYVRNFSIKNYSWQQRIGKYPKKKGKFSRKKKTRQ